MSDVVFCDPGVFLDVPRKVTARYRLMTHSPREFAAVLRTPIPHAAEASATVARLWHLGLAEDARRRSRRYEKARGKGGWLRFGRIQRLYLYFDSLAADHLQAAEKVTS